MILQLAPAWMQLAGRPALQLRLRPLQLATSAARPLQLQLSLLQLRLWQAGAATATRPLQRMLPQRRLPLLLLMLGCPKALGSVGVSCLQEMMLTYQRAGHQGTNTTAVHLALAVILRYVRVVACPTLLQFDVHA